MGDFKDIALFVVLLIGLLIAFPEYITKILENKIYTIFAGIGMIMIIFLVWLKIKNN